MVISSTNWLVEVVLGFDLGGDPAEEQRVDPVSHLHDVVHVVRDEHDADAGVGEPADQVEDLAGLRHTERGGRLVEEDDLGPFQSAALAMATVWRWPPERLATSWRTDFTVRTDRLASVSRALRSMDALVDRTPAGLHLAAQEHVLDDVEVVAQREVLIDDLDAERGGVARAVDVTGLPSKRNSPLSMG